MYTYIVIPIPIIISQSATVTLQLITIINLGIYLVRGTEFPCRDTEITSYSGRRP